MKKSSSSNPEFREATTQHRASNELVDLEFPVDAGFLACPPHLSSECYVEWCKDMVAALPGDGGKMRKKTKPELREEFNL